MKRKIAEGRTNEKRSARLKISCALLRLSCNYKVAGAETTMPACIGTTTNKNQRLRVCDTPAAAVRAFYSKKRSAQTPFGAWAYYEKIIKLLVVLMVLI